MQKLIIKNSEWLRGTGRRPGHFLGTLFDLQSKCYCVQGLYCRDHGVKAESMNGYITVAGLKHQDIPPNSAPALAWLIKELSNNHQVKSEEAHQIEKINDDTDTTDAEKIELLRPIFARHGIEIEYREDL